MCWRSKEQINLIQEGSDKHREVHDLGILRHTKIRIVKAVLSPMIINTMNDGRLGETKIQ